MMFNDDKQIAGYVKFLTQAAKVWAKHPQIAKDNTAFGETTQAAMKGA